MHIALAPLQGQHYHKKYEVITRVQTKVRKDLIQLTRLLNMKAMNTQLKLEDRRDMIHMISGLERKVLSQCDNIVKKYAQVREGGGGGGGEKERERGGGGEKERHREGETDRQT